MRHHNSVGVTVTAPDSTGIQKCNDGAELSLLQCIVAFLHWWGPSPRTCSDRSTRNWSNVLKRQSQGNLLCRQIITRRGRWDVELQTHNIHISHVSFNCPQLHANLQDNQKQGLVLSGGHRPMDRPLIWYCIFKLFESFPAFHSETDCILKHCSMAWTNSEHFSMPPRRPENVDLPSEYQKVVGLLSPTQLEECWPQSKSTECWRWYLHMLRSCYWTTAQQYSLIV